MQIDEKKIQSIVDEVMSQLGGKSVQAPTVGPRPASPALLRNSGRYGCFRDMDSAVKAARSAFEQLGELTLETRHKMIEAMRDVTVRNARELSQRAVEETGMGRVEDKVNKNILAATKTPGVDSVRPEIWTGDFGLTTMERAPFGVIGSIAPTTNPTETIVNNGISMIAAGNAVVFNAHPRAKKVSLHLIALLNQAIISAGGPDNLICCVEEPTLESANALMDHKGVDLLVVTGGPAVVDAAMSRRKKVIAAGPGNPPVVVDETAHVERAARDIYLGASLDNNIICVVEKEIIATKAVYDRLKAALKAQGAYFVRESLVPKLERCYTEDGKDANRHFVGKNASVILKAIGIEVHDDPRLIIAEVDEANPLVQVEGLMPVIPLVRVNDVNDGIDMAKRVEHGFRHTAVMHSTNLNALHRMARVMNCSIFVKNGPSYAGLGFTGEGYTSFTIASPTGEGLTYAKHFTRERRCVLKDYLRIV